jgi:sugar phosphate isomerase/epimerase
VPPGAEPCDLGGFFRALVEGGYDGRVSIEGDISKPDRNFHAALSHMKALEKKAR